MKDPDPEFSRIERELSETNTAVAELMEARRDWVPYPWYINPGGPWERSENLPN